MKKMLLFFVIITLLMGGALCKKQPDMPPPPAMKEVELYDRFSELTHTTAVSIFHNYEDGKANYPETLPYLRETNFDDVFLELDNLIAELDFKITSSSNYAWSLDDIIKTFYHSLKVMIKMAFDYEGCEPLEIDEFTLAEQFAVGIMAFCEFSPLE